MRLFDYLSKHESEWRFFHVFSMFSLKPIINLKTKKGGEHRDWGLWVVLACSTKNVHFIEKLFLFHLPALPPTTTSFDVEFLASSTTNIQRQEKVIQRFWQIIAAFFSITGAVSYRSIIPSYRSSQTVSKLHRHTDQNAAHHF